MSKDLKIEEVPSQAAAGDLETHTPSPSKGDEPSIARCDERTKQVEEFLIRLAPLGPWHLCRTGLWQGRTFLTVQDAVEAAAAANDRGHCVYYLGNKVKGGKLKGSRRKADIEKVLAVWIDVDDPDPDVAAELGDRLPWKPTYTAFTGGGWQAMWRLSAPTHPTDGEQIGLWLQSEFDDLGPDSVFSCEHIFRLPGTINRKEGRHNRLCKIYHSSWASVLPLDEAGRMEVKPRRAPVALESSSSCFDFPEAELREHLPPWALRLINHSIDAAGRPFASRSEHEHAFVGACLRDGVAPGLIEHCLVLPAGINDVRRVSHRSHWAKVRGRFEARRRPVDHALRQIGSHPEMGDAQ